MKPHLERVLKQTKFFIVCQVYRNRKVQFSASSAIFVTVHTKRELKVKNTKSLFQSKMGVISFTKRMRPSQLSLHSEHLKSAKSRISENQNCEKNEFKVHYSPLSSLFLLQKKFRTSSRMHLRQSRQRNICKRRVWNSDFVRKKFFYVLSFSSKFTFLPSANTTS